MRFKDKKKQALPDDPAKAHALMRLVFKKAFRRLMSPREFFNAYNKGKGITITTEEVARM
jgi:hypothetical protein